MPSMVLKCLQTSPNPNNEGDAAVIPVAQMKKLKRGFLDDLSSVAQLTSDGARVWSQAARLQNPTLTTVLSPPIPSDNVERKGLCNLQSSKAFSFSRA